MKEYYSNTIRIISFITLVAFMLTQAVPGYACLPSNTHGRQALRQVAEAEAKGNGNGIAYELNPDMPRPKQQEPLPAIIVSAGSAGAGIKTELRVINRWVFLMNAANIYWIAYCWRFTPYMLWYRPVALIAVFLFYMYHADKFYDVVNGRLHRLFETLDILPHNIKPKGMDYQTYVRVRNYCKSVLRINPDRGRAAETVYKTIDALGADALNNLSAQDFSDFLYIARNAYGLPELINELNKIRPLKDMASYNPAVFTEAFRLLAGLPAPLFAGQAGLRKGFDNETNGEALIRFLKELDKANIGKRYSSYRRNIAPFFTRVRNRLRQKEAWFVKTFPNLYEGMQILLSGQNRSLAVRIKAANRELRYISIASDKKPRLFRRAKRLQNILDDLIDESTAHAAATGLSRMAGVAKTAVIASVATLMPLAGSAQKAQPQPKKEHIAAVSNSNQQLKMLLSRYKFDENEKKIIRERLSDVAVPLAPEDLLYQLGEPYKITHMQAHHVAAIYRGLGVPLEFGIALTFPESKFDPQIAAGSREFSGPAQFRRSTAKKYYDMAVRIDGKRKKSGRPAVMFTGKKAPTLGQAIKNLEDALILTALFISEHRGKDNRVDPEDLLTAAASWRRLPSRGLSEIEARYKLLKQIIKPRPTGAKANAASQQQLSYDFETALLADEQLEKIREYMGYIKTAFPDEGYGWLRALNRSSKITPKIRWVESYSDDRDKSPFAEFFIDGPKSKDVSINGTKTTIPVDENGLAEYDCSRVSWAIVKVIDSIGVNYSPQVGSSKLWDYDVYINVVLADGRRIILSAVPGQKSIGAFIRPMGEAALREPGDKVKIGPGLFPMAWENFADGEAVLVLAGIGSSRKERMGGLIDINDKLRLAVVFQFIKDGESIAEIGREIREGENQARQREHDFEKLSQAQAQKLMRVATSKKYSGILDSIRTKVPPHAERKKIASVNAAATQASAAADLSPEASAKGEGDGKFTRRQFLKTTTAALALAGLGLTGCSREEEKAKVLSPGRHEEIKQKIRKLLTEDVDKYFRERASGADVDLLNEALKKAAQDTGHPKTEFAGSFMQLVKAVCGFYDKYGKTKKHDLKEAGRVWSLINEFNKDYLLDYSFYIRIADELDIPYILSYSIEQSIVFNITDKEINGIFVKPIHLLKGFEDSMTGFCLPKGDFAVVNIDKCHKDYRKLTVPVAMARKDFSDVADVVSFDDIFERLVWGTMIHELRHRLDTMDTQHKNFKFEKGLKLTGGEDADRELIFRLKFNQELSARLAETGLSEMPFIGLGALDLVFRTAPINSDAGLASFVALILISDEIARKYKSVKSIRAQLKNDLGEQALQDNDTLHRELLDAIGSGKISDEKIIRIVHSFVERVVGDKQITKTGLQDACSVAYQGWFGAPMQIPKDYTVEGLSYLRENIFIGVAANANAASEANMAGAESLLETFGHGSIHRVFDAGTGKAEWMRLIKGQPWLAEDSKIVGSELASPENYFPFDSPVISEEHWSGLTVVKTKDDEDYPKEESIDLLHEAFFDAERVEEIGTQRLDEYDRLVRPGGWFIFAHVKGILEPEQFISWLKSKGYPYVVYEEDDRPKDYPKTEWWEKTRWGRYLIVAHKENAEGAMFGHSLPQAVSNEVNFTIDTPKEADREAIFELSRYSGESVKDEPYISEKAFNMSLVGMGGHHIWVARDENNRVIGYIWAAVILDSDGTLIKVHINHTAVAEDMRRKHIGTVLAQHAIKELYGRGYRLFTATADWGAWRSELMLLNLGFKFAGDSKHPTDYALDLNAELPSWLKAKINAYAASQPPQAPARAEGDALEFGTLQIAGQKIPLHFKADDFRMICKIINDLPEGSPQRVTAMAELGIGGLNILSDNLKAIRQSLDNLHVEHMGLFLIYIIDTIDGVIRETAGPDLSDTAKVQKVRQLLDFLLARADESIRCINMRQPLVNIYKLIRKTITREGVEDEATQALLQGIYYRDIFIERFSSHVNRILKGNPYGIFNEPAGAYDIIKLYKFNAQGEHMSNLHCYYDVNTEPRAHIRIDREQFTVILNELIRNAHVHSDKKPVDLNVYTKNGSLVIEVKNPGSPISDETMRKMRLLFWSSLDEVRGDQRAGYGLGLALASAYIEFYDGSLEFENVNGNNIARVILPLDKLTAGTAPAQARADGAGQQVADRIQEALRELNVPGLEIILYGSAADMPGSHDLDISFTPSIFLYTAEQRKQFYDRVIKFLERKGFNLHLNKSTDEPVIGEGLTIEEIFEYRKKGIAYKRDYNKSVWIISAESTQRIFLPEIFTTAARAEGEGAGQANAASEARMIGDTRANAASQPPEAQASAEADTGNRILSKEESLAYVEKTRGFNGTITTGNHENFTLDEQTVFGATQIGLDTAKRLIEEGDARIEIHEGSVYLVHDRKVSAAPAFGGAVRGQTVVQPTVAAERKIPRQYKEALQDAEKKFREAMNGEFEFDHFLIFHKSSYMADRLSLSWGGAAIMICPLIAALRKTWPDKKITVVSEYPELADVFNDDDMVTSVLPEGFSEAALPDNKFFIIDFDEMLYSKYFKALQRSENYPAYVSNFTDAMLTATHYIQAPYFDSVRYGLSACGLDVPAPVINRKGHKKGTIFVNMHSNANKFSQKHAVQRQAWARVLKVLISEGYKVELYKGEKLGGTELHNYLDLENLEAVLEFLKQENPEFLTKIRMVGPWNRKELLDYILDVPEAIVTIQTGIFHIGGELAGIPTVVVTGQFDRLWIPTEKTWFRRMSIVEFTKNPGLVVPKLKELSVEPARADLSFEAPASYDELRAKGEGDRSGFTSGTALGLPPEPSLGNNLGNTGNSEQFGTNSASQNLQAQASAAAKAEGVVKKIELKNAADLEAGQITTANALLDSFSIEVVDNPATGRDFQKLDDDEKSEYTVLLKDDIPIGYMKIQGDILAEIYVEPKYRRTGVVYYLIEDLNNRKDIINYWILRKGRDPVVCIGAGPDQFVKDLGLGPQPEKLPSSEDIDKIIANREFWREKVAVVVARNEEGFKEARKQLDDRGVGEVIKIIITDEIDLRSIGGILKLKEIIGNEAEGKEITLTIVNLGGVNYNLDMLQANAKGIGLVRPADVLGDDAWQRVTDECV